MHFEEQVDVAQSPSELERDIQDVLNRHSAENPSGTPDFILAAYLQNCLYAFNQAVRARSDWRGESVELPALQRLREDNEREVPLVVYTDGRRNEIGTARVQVTPGEMYVTGQISGAVAQLFQDPGVSYSVENSSPLREPKDEPLPQTRPTSRFERYQQEGLSS
jgi:hypothetical protein